MRYLFLVFMVLVGVGMGSSAKAQTPAWGWCISDTVSNALLIEMDDGRGTFTHVNGNMAPVQDNVALAGEFIGPTYETWVVKAGAAAMSGGFWGVKTDTKTGRDAYKIGNKLTCYTDAGNAADSTAYDFVCTLNNVATPCDTF